MSKVCLARFRYSDLKGGARGLLKLVEQIDVVVLVIHNAPFASRATNSISANRFLMKCVYLKLCLCAQSSSFLEHYVMWAAGTVSALWPIKIARNCRGSGMVGCAFCCYC